MLCRMSVITTGGSARLTIDLSGNATFSNPPQTSVNATLANDLTRLGMFSTISTYNPVLSSGSPPNNLNSGNYNVREGHFIRIGNLVWFQVRLSISGKGGLGAAGETIQITLPVAAGNIGSLIQSLSMATANNMTTSIVSANGNIPLGGSTTFNILIRTAASASAAAATVGDISTTFEARVGGFYFA